MNYDKPEYNYTPDWESHNDFISHNKHYYHPSHEITMCNSYELCKCGEKELSRLGHKGTTGQIVHPVELGYYKYWQDRNGVEGCLVPEKQSQIKKFMAKYDPNSKNAKTITFKD